MEGDIGYGYNTSGDHVHILEHDQNDTLGDAVLYSKEPKDGRKCSMNSSKRKWNSKPFTYIKVSYYGYIVVEVGTH